MRGMLRPQCSMRGGDVRAVPCRELSRKWHARAAHLERGLPAAAEQGGLGRVQGPAQVPPHPLALEPGKKGLKPLNSTLAIVHARESAMCWPAQRRMMRSCALTLAWRAPLATSSRGTEGCCSPAPAHRCLPQPRVAAPQPRRCISPERAGAVSVACERRPQLVSSSTGCTHFSVRVSPTLNLYRRARRLILVAEPSERITMAEIQRHAWFVRDLPEGVAQMNSALLAQQQAAGVQ